MSVPQTSPLPALQRGVFLSGAWYRSAWFTVLPCWPLSRPRRPPSPATPCRTISSISAMSTRPFSRTCAMPGRTTSPANRSTAMTPRECVLVRQAAEALKTGAGRSPRQGPHAQSLRLLPPCPRRRRVRRLGEGAGRSEVQDDLLSQSRPRATCSPITSPRARAIRAARRSISRWCRSITARRQRERPSRNLAPRRKRATRPTAAWLWARASIAST